MHTPSDMANPPQVWCKFYDEVFLESAQADEAMYSMACFNLKRTGRTLHELILAQRPFKLHLCCQFVVNSLNDETIVGVRRAFEISSGLTLLARCR